MADSDQTTPQENQEPTTPTESSDPVVTSSFEQIIDDFVPVKQVEVKIQDVDPNARKDQNVQQEFDIHSAEQLTNGDEFTFPSHFDKETREVLEKIPNINLLDSPSARQWAQDVSEGLSYNTQAEVLVDALQRPESDFKHNFTHNGQSLNAAAPKFKPIENTKLEGERAVVRLITHLGLGSLFSVPLWHSGIWLTLKPPTESELVELNRLMTSDKIQFGRYTYGLAYSNTVSYTVDRIVDFILSHVYDITTKAEDITVANLKNHISSQDIFPLIWGFICTIYPKGFKYRRACIAKPDSCNYILEETLNVWKLQWTDTSALTDWQKTFMSQRQPKSRSADEIKRYKEELKNSQKKRITVNEGEANEFSVTLKSPSISQYIDSGHRWIGEITEIVNKTLGMDASDTERNNYITRYGQASAMRNYVHWIDSIEYGTVAIDDSETIEKTLDILTQDDEVRVKFIQAVVDYINQSSISIIGIPVFDCPGCGKVQQSSIQLPRHTNIIPLDVIQLFFAILAQRLARISQR